MSSDFSKCFPDNPAIILLLQCLFDVNRLDLLAYTTLFGPFYILQPKLEGFSSGHYGPLTVT